ncbi:MAG: 16S rRNA (adenine(1518)-N(6)/adenine(1519)-N(6))-dimethyltransferase RsmA [Ureaplasma sp.]|nr:16S rRNA (adenine(1518)-N(6)/adenine(1519)-N(6))-dimethyltransferase RsmA [Ureaplasma sp.]
MSINQSLNNHLKNKPFLASKKMGQNFLINSEIQKKIVNSSNLINGDCILEIGPGMGAITGILLSHKINLFAIELDKRLYSYLKEKFASNNNFSLFNDDALKLDWNIFLSNYPGKQFKIIANLPYSISSALVLKLINYPQINLAIVMVQKEFAQRMSAKVGSKHYNMFSVSSQLFFNTKVLFDVSPNNFKPAPKVISSVIEIKRKENIYLNNLNSKFNNFLRLCFSNRRKTLLNNLLKIFSKDKILESFVTLNIRTNTRAQEISPDIFVNLFNYFYE